MIDPIARHAAGLSLTAAALVAAPALAGPLATPEVNVTIADLAGSGLLGTQIAELDAVAEGFTDFGGGVDPFRNLNLVTKVFVNDTGGSIDLGPVTLLPGDFTYAYIRDFTSTANGVANGTADDFQINRVVGAGFAGDTGPTLGDVESLVVSAGYSVGDDGSGGDAFAFDSSAITIFVPGAIDQLQAQGASGEQLVQGEADAYFLFIRGDVTPFRIGFNSSDGVEAIGTSFAGNGATIESINGIPTLIPVLVPEPATTGLLLAAGFMTIRRRRG
ncbi:MAG: PEP-CTERM sorting domain-containing protein [Planctomycetota bacterium]